MFSKKVAFLKHGQATQFNVLGSLRNQLISSLQLDYESSTDGISFKVLDTPHNKRSYLWIHQKLARYLYGGTDDEKPKSEYSFHCLKTIDNETYYVFAIKRWEKRYTIDVPYLTLEIPGPLDDSIPLNTGVAAALISPDILPWEKLSSPVQSALHVFVPPHAIKIPRKGLFYHYWTNDLKFVPITLTTAKKLRFKQKR